jgi:signal transduction histidine kinase
MRLKIRERMLLIIVGVFLLVFSIGYLYGSQAFPGYYQKVELQRLTELMGEFERIELASSEVPVAEWETLALQNDALVQIFNAKGDLIYWKGTSGQGMQGMRGQGRGRVAQDGISGEYSGITVLNNLPGEWLVNRHETDEGSTILLQSPMGEVEAAVSVFLTFLKRIFMLGLILAVIAAWFAARNLSRPIARLNNQAKAMAKLDFKERFSEERSDEIGELGNSINELSQQLADTIERLQSELIKEKSLEAMRKGFVAKVSHELQTPLAVIQGYVEGLEDGLPADEEERREYYVVIEEEIQALSRMARDLTDLSQLESGAFQMKKEKIDVRTWMEGIAERFRRMSGSDQIDFLEKIDEDDLILWADRQRLSQAVFNLLNNARRHTGINGVIRFTIDSDPSHIWIRIWNQGHPIDSKEIEELWKGFYRGKKEESRGMGLGLAIVDQIVKAHHGERAVENREKGVLFTLKFPR